MNSRSLRRVVPRTCSDRQVDRNKNGQIALTHLEMIIFVTADVKIPPYLTGTSAYLKRRKPLRLHLIRKTRPRNFQEKYLKINSILSKPATDNIGLPRCTKLRERSTDATTFEASLDALTRILPLHEHGSRGRKMNVTLRLWRLIMKTTRIPFIGKCFGADGRLTWKLQILLWLTTTLMRTSTCLLHTRAPAILIRSFVVPNK